MEHIDIGNVPFSHLMHRRYAGDLLTLQVISVLVGITNEHWLAL